MPQNSQEQVRYVEQDEQVFLLTGVAVPIDHEVRGDPRQQHQAAAGRRKTQPPPPQQDVDFQPRNQQQESDEAAQGGDRRDAQRAGQRHRQNVQIRDQREIGVNEVAIGHSPVQEQLGLLQVEGAVGARASRRLPHPDQR